MRVKINKRRAQTNRPATISQPFARPPMLHFHLAAGVCLTPLVRVSQQRRRRRLILVDFWSNLVRFSGRLRSKSGGCSIVTKGARARAPNRPTDRRLTDRHKSVRGRDNDDAGHQAAPADEIQLAHLMYHFVCSSPSLFHSHARRHTLLICTTFLFWLPAGRTKY